MRPFQYPEPGKIHKLPIQVFYNIPSSDHTFVTTLDAAQSVFVHSAIDSRPSQIRGVTRSKSVSSHRDVHRAGPRSRKRRKLEDNSEGYGGSGRGSDSAEEEDEEDRNDDDSDDEGDERWLVLGSTSLKAVMEGVCKASPELVPSANSPDSSIYIPVLQPKSSSKGTVADGANASSRHASATPGPALLIPKIESQDPSQTAASFALPYPYGPSPVQSPANGQYIYSHAQPPPQPLSAAKRNGSVTSNAQVGTPAGAPLSSPLPQRTVSNSTTGSQAATPANTGLQTPTQTHAKTANGRGFFTNMPPPATGQRTATTTGTPAPVPMQYPPPPHGQPYGYPYPPLYPGYPGHPQYPGYPPYPPHMSYAHPGYQPNSAPVPILVPVSGPQSHGQAASSSTSGPASSPYPYHPIANTPYAQGMTPTQLPGYPYPLPAPYPSLPLAQGDHRIPDPSGVSNTLGIQSDHVTFQGKGLLSWILAERGDGKTLVKGKVVRCDGWDGFLGLGTVEDSDQSEDESEVAHDGNHADAEGGLEALVKAAARRNERKRKREERELALTAHSDRHDQRSEGSSRIRVKWGIEIRVNLRLMNGSLPSKVTIASFGKSPTVKRASAAISERSVNNAVNSTHMKSSAVTTAGRPVVGLPAPRSVGAPAQISKSVAATPARPSMTPTPAAGQTASIKQPATFVNGSLQHSRPSGQVHPSSTPHPASVAKTKHSGGLREDTTRTSTSVVDTGSSASTNPLAGPGGSISGTGGRTIARSQTRASVQPTSQAASLALRRVHQSTANGGTPNESTPGSTPTPSIAIPLKTGITLDSALKTPPERSTTISQSSSKTPSGKTQSHGHVASADRIDHLRTPRQSTHRTSLPTPKSSPATGLALAKSILRYPASQHTIELAQKLVGKEMFQNIVSEMGLHPAEIIRESPVKNKPSKLSESVNITSRTQPATTRAKAINSLENPLLDQADQARASTSGPLATSQTNKQNISGKRTASQPSHESATSNTVAQHPAKSRVLSCDHCKTTETRVWRVKQLPGGKERRVCDACGLYFNTTKKMRPKELWGTQKIELPGTSVKTRQQAAALTDAHKGKEKEVSVVIDTTVKSGMATTSHTTQQSTMSKTYDLNASPQRKARPSTSNALDSSTWTPRRSSRLNRHVDLSPTGRPPGSHHKPALDEVCDAAMSPRRSTRLTPRKISKGKNKDIELVATGKAQKRLMELTKDASTSSPRRSLTPALAAVAGTGGLDKQSGHAIKENIWDDNDFSFLLSDNIDEIQEAGSFATDPVGSSSGLDFEMEQYLSTSDQRAPVADFNPDLLLNEGEGDDHEPKFTQKEMELLLMLSSGIASEEMGPDVPNVEPLNAVAGPSRQGHLLLDGTEWTDESSPWEISTPSAAQWKLS